MSTINSSGTAGTNGSAAGDFVSFELPKPSTLAVGEFFVVAVAKSNDGAVDGATTEVASLSDPTGAIQWSRLYEYCNANGAANAGVTISLWVGVVKSAYVISTSVRVTATMAASSLNMAITAWKYTGIAAAATLQWLTPVVTSAVDAGAIASVASGTLPSREYLIVRAESVGGNASAFTKTAGWTSALTTKAASGNNVVVAGEFNIVTGTSATSNPTNAGSYNRATVLAAIYQQYQPYSYALGWAF